jgi:putative transposase
LWNYWHSQRRIGRRYESQNIIERINKGLKRRSSPVGAFPSDQSLMRLAGCIMININEEWIMGKKYLTMDEE